MKIRTRIFVVFVLSLVTGFVLLGWWISDELKAFHNQSYEEVLVDTANVFAELVEKQISDGNHSLGKFKTAFEKAREREISALIYGVHKQELDLRVYVTDSKGIVIFDSDNENAVGDDYSGWRDVWLTLKGEYGARTTDEIISKPEESGNGKKFVSVSYVAAPIMNNGVIVGVVSIGKPKTNIYKFVDVARQDVLIAILISVAIAISMAFFLYLWVSKPLQSLVVYAKKVMRGERAEPPLNGGQEINDVAYAMRDMRAALEDKQYVERYVQTLTHELKSPITAIMTSAELLNGELPTEKRYQFTNNIIKEAERLNEFSCRLLQLAAVEKQEQLQEFTVVHIPKLLSDIATSIYPLMQKKKLILNIVLDQDVKAAVEGDIFLLKQALENLLRNAIDFSPVSGEIRIQVNDYVGKNREFCEIAIYDQGEGVPEYALPHIFDRFYSLPRTSEHNSGIKSTGLGLNFVNEVAELHGGSITIENVSKGGAKATLHLKHTISTL